MYTHNNPLQYAPHVGKDNWNDLKKITGITWKKITEITWEERSDQDVNVWS